MITLGEYIIAQQNEYPKATGELSLLLSSIRLAAKVVNREINTAGLVDIIGVTGLKMYRVKYSKKWIYLLTMCLSLH